MTAHVPVFVNAERIEVPAGASVLDAVRLWSEGMARDVGEGARVVTDSRGLPIALDARVHAGAIFRLVPARDRAAHDDDLPN